MMAFGHVWQAVIWPSCLAGCDLAILGGNGHSQCGSVSCWLSLKIWDLATKMEHENEQENDHFHKSDGMVQFFKNDHFSSNFVLIFYVHFLKMKLKMNLKIS